MSRDNLLNREMIIEHLCKISSLNQTYDDVKNALGGMNTTDFLQASSERKGEISDKFIFVDDSGIDTNNDLASIGEETTETIQTAQVVLRDFGAMGDRISAKNKEAIYQKNQFLDMIPKLSAEDDDDDDYLDDDDDNEMAGIQSQQEQISELSTLHVMNSTINVFDPVLTFSLI